MAIASVESATERAAGRTVDHLHVHLIPRYNGDMEDPKRVLRQSIVMSL